MKKIKKNQGLNLNKSTLSNLQIEESSMNKIIGGNSAKQSCVYECQPDEPFSVIYVHPVTGEIVDC